MPWPLLIPLITAGVSAAGQIFGAKKASETAKTVAQTQSTAATEMGRRNEAAVRQALEYIAAQRGAQGMTGSGAAGSLERLLGVAPRPMMPGPSGYGFRPGVANYQGGSGDYRQLFGGPSGLRLPGAGSPGPLAPDLVELEAPSGQRKLVPAAHVEHFLSRGARRV